MDLLRIIGAPVLFTVAFLSFACCVLPSVAYWRREKREKGRRERWRADIADISILFQTMRDVIGQQKSLAREFNQELDTKLSLVKQVISTTLEKNERLFEQQQQISRALDQSRAQIESLQRQVGYLQGTIGEAAQSPPAPQPPRSRSAPEDAGPKAYVSLDSDRERRVPLAQSREESPLDLPFEDDDLEGTGLTDAAYSKWEGFDLDAGQSLHDPPPHAPRDEFVPQAPEDAEAARQAFRALLDIGDAEDVAEAPGPLLPGVRAEAPAPTWEEQPASKAARSNGRSKTDALRQRVSEYHEAGMEVPEIARELGVSKGEVRLMLSLARQHRM